MGDLTAHFSAWEFACPCCGLDEINLGLVTALESLRVLAGRSIRVNSGCRCGTHNKRRGGAPYSRHLRGNAADIVIGKLGVLEMYEVALQEFRDGGIGLYPKSRFIHVDNRGERARWGWLRGGMVSIEDAIAYLKFNK